MSGAARAIDEVVDAGEYAAQDVHFLALESRAREQPAQARHQPLRHCGIEEAHRRERADRVRVQALDLVVRKLRHRDGKDLNDFVEGISQFVTAHRDDPAVGEEVRALAATAAHLQEAGVAQIQYMMTGKLDQFTLSASPFLEAMSHVTVAYLLLEAAIITVGGGLAALGALSLGATAYGSGAGWLSPTLAGSTVIQHVMRAVFPIAAEVRALLTDPASADVLAALAREEEHLSQAGTPLASSEEHATSQPGCTGPRP